MKKGPTDKPSSKPNYRPIFTISLKNQTLQLTWEGGGFTCLTFGVGLGAINTGNNLLYLVLAMCCSFIALSGILSELTLRKVRVEGTLAGSMYAGEPYPLRLRITNMKNRLSSYSLRISLSGEHESRFRLDRDVYCFQIPPRSTIERTLMITAANRGWLRIKTYRIWTGFPFGFFLKTKTRPLEIETVVFPAIRNVALPSADGLFEEGERRLQTRGEELLSLRAFQPGDSMNLVHWKSSAKTGSLRVKEFVHGTSQKFMVPLDVHDPATGEIVEHDILEKRVSESASRAYHLIRRGDAVSLKTSEFQTPFGSSEPHLESLMRTLAFIGLKEH